MTRNLHNIKHSTGQSIAVQTNNDISLGMQPETSDDSDICAQDACEISIPIATLVEENTSAGSKMLYIVALIALTVLILSVGVGVGLAKASSSNTQTTEAISAYKNVSPQEVQLINNYTVWIKSNEIGERSFYYGAICNPLGLQCSKCGAYEVNAILNEVIGT